MRITLILLVWIMFGCATTPSLNTQTMEFKQAWSKETLYFLLIDRFNNGNRDNDFNVSPTNPLAYHGGDLQGLRLKLKYIQALDFSSILTNPLMDNRNTDFFGHWGFHGYWIIDHYQIDEHWGTKEDFKAFNDQRIDAGLKLIIDLVLNHVEWNHPWVNEHPDWFHTLESISDWNDPKQLVEGRISGLPDLDQDNSSVYTELLNYGKYWIDFARADGFRFDAVKHIDHSFWKRFISDIYNYFQGKYSRSDFLFLGEVLHGDPEYYIPYMDDGFNAFYDYPLYYTLKEVFADYETLFKLPTRLQTEDKIFPPYIILATFLDNHDMPRFLSLSDKVNYKDLEQALAFIMTIRGLPVIYYGTESHLTGKSGEMGRKDMSFTHTPSAKVISQLNTLRHRSPSLTNGIREDLAVDRDYYIYRKISPDEESIIVITRGTQGRILEYRLEPDSLFSTISSIKEKLSGREFIVRSKPDSSKVLALPLKKKDFVIFTLAGNSPRYRFLKESPPEMVNLTIELEAPSLSEDEIPYMVGNLPCLGNWKPEKALKLEKAGGSPIYRIQFKIPIKTMIEYKFVKRGKEELLEWESVPNRFFFAWQKDNKSSLKWNEL